MWAQVQMHSPWLPGVSAHSVLDSPDCCIPNTRCSHFQWEGDHMPFISIIDDQDDMTIGNDDNDDQDDIDDDEDDN